MVSSHVENNAIRESQSKHIATNSIATSSSSSSSSASSAASASRLQRKMVSNATEFLPRNVSQLPLQLQQHLQRKMSVPSQQHEVQRRKLQAPSPLKQQQQQQQQPAPKTPDTKGSDCEEPANQEEDTSVDLDTITSSAVSVPVPLAQQHQRPRSLAVAPKPQQHQHQPQETRPVSRIPHHPQPYPHHRHHATLQPARQLPPRRPPPHHHSQRHQTSVSIPVVPAPPAQSMQQQPYQPSQSLRNPSSSFSQSFSNSYCVHQLSHQWHPSQCQSPSQSQRQSQRPSYRLNPSSTSSQYYRRHTRQESQQWYPHASYYPSTHHPTLSTTTTTTTTTMRARGSSDIYNMSSSCPDVDPRSFRLRPLDSSELIEDQFCGWLWMRKSKFSRWQNRYFCLNGTMLSYFTSFPSEDFLRQATSGAPPTPVSPSGTSTVGTFVHAETSQPRGVLRIAHVDESKSRLGFKVYGTCGTSLDIRAPRLDLRNDWLRALKAPARRKSRAWTVGCPEELSISLACLEQDTVPIPERQSIPIVKCGWLDKQMSTSWSSSEDPANSGLLGRFKWWSRWQKYFFVIQGKMLSFYASDRPYDVPKRRGYIVGVCSVKSEKKLRIQLEDPQPFSIVVRAKDLEELEQWRESLLVCLHPTMCITL